MAENRLTVPTNPARALRELNRQPTAAAPDIPPDNDVNNTTILQSDKPTDRQTDQQTSRPTNIETDLPTNTPTNKPSNKPTKQQPVKSAPVPPEAATPRAEVTPRAEETRPRVDGRTLRVRQETADRTMVTSLRLAVSTIEALDEFCWKQRQRKQDVVQAALDLYFASMETEE